MEDQMEDFTKKSQHVSGARPHHLFFPGHKDGGWFRWTELDYRYVIIKRSIPQQMVVAAYYGTAAAKSSMMTIVRSLF